MGEVAVLFPFEDVEFDLDAGRQPPIGSIDSLLDDFAGHIRHLPSPSEPLCRLFSARLGRLCQDVLDKPDIRMGIDLSFFGMYLEPFRRPSVTVRKPHTFLAQCMVTGRLARAERQLRFCYITVW